MGFVVWTVELLLIATLGIIVSYFANTLIICNNTRHVQKLWSKTILSYISKVNTHNFILFIT